MSERKKRHDEVRDYGSYSLTAHLAGAKYLCFGVQEGHG